MKEGDERDDGYLFAFTPWKITPQKTSMFPENQWLEDVFPIKVVFFGGTC